MAVLALKSAELDVDYRKYPVNDHGKFRIQYFSVPAVAVAGDANTTIDLCMLPPGRVRVVPNLSRLTNSAFGVGRTLDIGHTAYASRDSGAGDAEAADVDAFADGLDMATAATAVAFGTALKYDIYSKSGVLVQATVLGGTIPVGATLSGFIVYIYE